MLHGKTRARRARPGCGDQNRLAPVVVVAADERTVDDISSEQRAVRDFGFSTIALSGAPAFDNSVRTDLEAPPL